MKTKRILSVSFALGIALILAVTSVYAFNVHLGKGGKLHYVDQGLYLDVEGTLKGLGNDDVLISLDAEADVVATCTNNGGNAAPAQNPAPITVTGSEEYPASEITKLTPFNVLTEEPPSEIPGAPDCPNTNWTESIDDLLFTNATIAVEQGETTVLTVECTFDPSTSDGGVKIKSFNCH